MSETETSSGQTASAPAAPATAAAPKVRVIARPPTAVEQAAASTTGSKVGGFQKAQQIVEAAANKVLSWHSENPAENVENQSLVTKVQAEATAAIGKLASNVESHLSEDDAAPFLTFLKDATEAAQTGENLIKKALDALRAPRAGSPGAGF